MLAPALEAPGFPGILWKGQAVLGHRPAGVGREAARSLRPRQGLHFKDPRGQRQCWVQEQPLAHISVGARRPEDGTWPPVWIGAPTETERPGPPTCRGPSPVELKHQTRREHRDGAGLDSRETEAGQEHVTRPKSPASAR